MSKAERTKQFIIEQAAPIFNEKGIAGTSVDDVLKAAKVAKGCLYHHFENKEDLSYATIDFLLKKITDRIAMVTGKETTAKAKIYAYLDFNKQPLLTYIDGGCPIFNMAVEADNNNPVVKQKVKDVLVKGQKMFASILKDGISNEEFSATLNPEEFSFKMFAAIEGATIICRILDSNKPMQGLVKSLKQELAGYALK
jgi:TetR/AcrR family transcriptional repressor of nem operon